MQRGTRPPDTHEPNDRDRRRAAVVDAYLQTSADAIDDDTRRNSESSELLDQLYDRVPEHLLNEEHDGRPTRRAHIARALAESAGQYFEADE